MHSQEASAAGLAASAEILVTSKRSDISPFTGFFHGVHVEFSGVSFGVLAGCSLHCATLGEAVGLESGKAGTLREAEVILKEDDLRCASWRSLEKKLRVSKSQSLGTLRDAKAGGEDKGAQQPQSSNDDPQIQRAETQDSKLRGSLQDAGLSARQQTAGPGFSGFQLSESPSAILRQRVKSMSRDFF